MQFLIDAQLPASLKDVFEFNNISCIHTIDLPNQNLTTDTEIRLYCKQNNTILITKDEDFYHTHLLTQNPEYLILVKVGNCSNSLLKDILSTKLQVIIDTIYLQKFIIISR